MCLFHILKELSGEWDLTLHPVHINHMLRPGAAEEDAAYVEKLCEEAGCPARVYTFDCSAIAEEEKMTSEEAGRKVRYQAFADTARMLREEGVSGDDIRIAVAHNRDDQAETILFRILRGTGTDGLAGISYARTDSDGNRIIRPLLDVSREEIMEYCSRNGLQPRMDHTNEEPVYTRNRIRLQLIPYLQREYNGSIQAALTRMGKAAAMDSSCLWEQAQQAFEALVLERGADSVLLSGPELAALPRAVRQRVFSLAFSRAGLTEDLTFAHFESCENILFNERPSARCSLPRGYYLTKVYGDVRIGRDEHDGQEDWPDFRITVMDTNTFRGKEYRKDTFAAFDLEKLKQAFGEDAAQKLVLCGREKGDVLQIGEGRSKKLQDYFVDQKIPRDRRDRIPVLKIGRQVLWVLPAEGRGRYSSGFRLDEDTKTVICIEIIC